ncbi:MAG: aromatic ring-hydroxylating oxygenase subunit alpha [Myxococcota bacterium]
MISTRLPPSFYTEPLQFQAEQSRILEQNWLVMGHVGMVSNSQIVARQIGSVTVLLARDPEGALKAFHNVCRHRAGPLTWPGRPAEACKTIRCKYHGWSYDWNGQLLNAPSFGTAIPQDSLPLTPIHCLERNGLIWIYLGTDDPLMEQSTVHIWDSLKDLTAFQLHQEVTHQLACNWKVYAENYLEGYHIPYMHPDLVKSIKMSTYQIDVQDGLISHHVNLRKNSVHQGYWVFLWPNTAINVYGNGASIERIVPVSENQTEIVYQYLFLSDTSDKEITETIAESDQLTKEDALICEAVQRNLASGAYAKGFLSPDHEQGVLAFQNWVMKAMNDGGTPC